MTPLSTQAIPVAALATVAALTLTACGLGSAIPDRDADATGTVASISTAGGVAHFTLTTGEQGDYFWDATITVMAEDLVDSSGKALDPSELKDGDAVSVWTDVCAESYPVQCSAVAVRRD